MKKLLLSLLLIVIIVTILYLGLDFYTLGGYVQQARMTKLITFVIVAILIIPSTIVFQTLIASRYLSPNILGIDAVYVLIQSFIYFVGYHHIDLIEKQSLILYVIQMGLMLGLFYLTIKISKVQWTSTVGETMWLMIGLVFGTVLRNISTFFQVLMDPNEYLRLQTQLFASFQGISRSLLGISIVISLLGLGFFYRKRHVLDVYYLGKEMALTLGVDIQKETTKMLLVIIIMIGTATALVGPLTFLGFMIANITYFLTPKQYHTERIFVGILLGITFMIGGQFLVERVFNYQYHLNIMIEGVGGLLFFILLVRKEGKQFDHH